MRGTPIKQTSSYKDFKYYANENTSEKKNVLVALIEMEKLSWYWKCYPDTYFLYGMHAKSFKDYKIMKTFIPTNAYSRYVGSTEYDILLNDKILFHHIMDSYDLPVPKRFFYFRENKFYINDRLSSSYEVDEVIKNISDEIIFQKKFRGGKGSGISIYTKQENGYIDVERNRLSADFIKEKYNNINVLFEKQIIQEPILRSFCPDTVNTIRVQVIKNKNNEDEIIAASVRFGRKGNFMDKINQGSLVVSINIDNGEIAEFGMKQYDTNRYYSHPDTNKPFKNVKIDQWDSIRNLVFKTLEYLPYYKGVGFDIVTTDDGPIIIEINLGAGMI